jgi:acyl-CoA thioester hydrolase
MLPVSQVFSSPNPTLPPPAPGFREGWYEYPVRVQPHHTDYAGIAWHGTYLSWMETARVECLGAVGVNFADLVALGCDLPVVDLQLHYHRAASMGAVAIVKTRLLELERVRIPWEYRIEAPDATLLVSGSVALVPVDRNKAKILRQLPSSLQEALLRLRSALSATDLE